MNTIAYQGETGAFSELAAKKFFSGKILLSPSLTFEKVFKKVKTGEADFGIVPVENSLYGSVFETFDLLLKNTFTIVGELNLQINHYFMSNKRYNLNEIRKVYSHPQALGQCSNFLKSLKSAEIFPVYDTAGAAKIISLQKEKYSAAIASKIAADEYGLKIIKSYVQNNEQNFTRFLVISRNRKSVKPFCNEFKTSICFELKSIPGALYKALSVFALRDINLTKIESRPIPHKAFQYMFYIDLNGNIKEKKIKLALNHLKEISQSVRIFGSYCVGKTYSS